LTKPRRTPPRAKGCKPDKLVRDAIIIALKREAVDGEGKPTRRLTLIAEKLVEKAVAGDIHAIKEIADRVDGKATQPLAGDEAGPRLITRIERVIVRPQSVSPDSPDRKSL
jgi:hypothetical protein